MADQRDIAPELWFEKLARESRRMIQCAMEILSDNSPDTFLGRKTYEPFPQEESQCGNA